MEWQGFGTYPNGATMPGMLTGTKSLRLDGDFTIKAVIKPHILGGKKVVVSKRWPLGEGNRPGMLLLVHGNCVELMTFENGGRSWRTARTIAQVIQLGELHEILAFRIGDRACIYVNGIDRTNPTYQTIHAGDLNCDVEMFVGCQVYNEPEPKDVFKGVVHFLGFYEQEHISDATPLRFMKNPYHFSLDELPEMSKRLGIPLVRG